MILARMWIGSVQKRDKFVRKQVAEMRSLTLTPTEMREHVVRVVNEESNDYNKVLNGNFVGLYCLTSWFDTKVSSKSELVDFELTRLRTQFLIKIKKILARLRFPNFIVINALYFLDLVHEYAQTSEDYPVFYKTKEDNLFLNFIVCLMVANKSSNDFAIKSKYWARLTKIPVRKINELELLLLNLVLKHNVLALNFNVAKLASYNDKLQSMVHPFSLYIDDFNAKFNSAYNTAPKPLPVVSPKESYTESSSDLSTSPSSSSYSENSEYSSVSPNSSSNSIYDKDVKIQTIASADHLDDYIQTPTTSFKCDKPTAANSYLHTSLPNPYNYVNFEQPRQQQPKQTSDEAPRYRGHYYSLEIYQN